MRILQIGKFYPIRGGVEKVMWDLTKGLNARGIDCDMLCAMLKEDGFDEADKCRVISEGRIRVMGMGGSGRCICVPAFAKVAATMLSPSMVFWLAGHKSEYDVIHIHHPDPMACLALFLSGYRGRVVLHWHSDILKQKGLLSLYRPLQRWLVRRADRIVGTSPDYVAASPSLASVQEKVTYLPIGIEDNVRSSVRQESGAGEKVVFSLGRLVEYKGYSYLIDAAGLLPEDYRVVIAGKGPLRDELQQRIGSQGLADRVRLLGYVSDEEARLWYNRSSVFVLSSVMKTEAFGIVQLEAMSCGKPVIATRIPGSGTAWVNADGVSGLNVDICDAAAIADAVVSVCGEPERYSGFCRAARERYESMFTLDRMIDGAIEIYSSL